MQFFFTIIFCFFAIFIKSSWAKQPLIATSINPIYQIVLAITQDKSNISLIINQHSSEHNYQLQNSDIKKIKNADLVFYISDNLEHNIAKLAKNDEKKTKYWQLINIESIKLLKSRTNNKNFDQHIWLDPENSIKIAEFITDKIIEFDVKNSQKYKNNLDKFVKETLRTKNDILKNLANNSQIHFVIYHDGYQYFENYFKVQPLMIIASDYDQELNIKSFKQLDNLVKSKKVHCILGDIQDEKNSAQKLASRYNLNFFNLDLMGATNNENNQYQILISNLAKALISCSN